MSIAATSSSAGGCLLLAHPSHQIASPFPCLGASRNCHSACYFFSLLVKSEDDMASGEVYKGAGKDI